MSVTLISSLQYNNLNTFNAQQKLLLENAIQIYQNTISAYLELSSSIQFKKNDYLTAVVEEQNTLSKKYTQERYNANAVLSSWMIQRYDDGQDIRTQQTTTSSLYQNRIYKLEKLYKHHSLSSQSQLNAFKNWYEPLMILNKDNKILSCDCEDYDVNYLFTNSYPSATIASGYSSKFLTMPYDQIYDLSSITYVKDYPNNLQTLQSFNPGTITIPKGILYEYPDRKYTDARLSALYDKYKELIDYRNNIKQQTYKKLVKKQRYKNYINSSLSTTLSGISGYNYIVSTHIENTYMNADAMNTTLWQQDNKTIELNWPWSMAVSTTLLSYRRTAYPRPLSGNYGQNFYDLSELFE